MKLDVVCQFVQHQMILLSTCTQPGTYVSLARESWAKSALDLEPVEDKVLFASSVGQVTSNK